MKTEAALEMPARAQMRQRYPGVLRIPDNRRNGAKKERPDQQVHAGPLEFASKPWNQRQDDQNRKCFKRIRILAKKAEPNQQTGKQPIPRAPKVLGVFHGKPEGKHRRYPEKN